MERGGLIGLVALAAYGVLASTYIVDGDNAEFATLAHTGGLAHPSGYPAYVLWLRALAPILPGSPARAAALATAILGAATLVVLVNACRAWGVRTGAATLAVAFLGGAPIVLRVHTEAEVFAMNNLACATILWLAARRGPVRGIWRGALLGAVAGIGLADHLTCALIAPIGILGVVRAIRESKLAAPASAVGLAVGLAAYAYAFVAPDTPMSWGAVHDLHGLVGLVTRRDYGGALAFAPVAKSVSAWSQLGALAMSIGRAWLWLPAAGALAMLGVRCARRDDHDAGESRVAWAMLALSWLLAGPILASRFDIVLDDIGLAVCRRFHVLPALLLAIPAAAAIDAIPWRAPRVARVLAAALALPASIALALPGLGRVHTAAVERYAQNVLEELPDGAVLIVGEDYIYAGSQYVQWALGERADAIVIDSGLLPFGWYRDRLAARSVPMPPGNPSATWVVEHAIAAGKRVFIDLKQKDVIAHLPTFPYGAVLAVGAPPSLDDLVALNDALYAGFRRDYVPPGPDDEYASVIQRHYSAMRELLARALEAAGRRDEAAALRAQP
ncbi:MAG TPA: DUF2723 domain-containing protein [Kofleriaceae bacterium]